MHLQNTPNSDLHVRLAALRKQEAAAGALFDTVDAKRAALLRKGSAIGAVLARRFDEADSAYDAAVDARIEIENAIVAAPMESKADVRAKLRILIGRADTWGDADVSGLAEQFVGQVMAFAKRGAAN